MAGLVLLRQVVLVQLGVRGLEVKVFLGNGNRWLRLLSLRSWWLLLAIVLRWWLSLVLLRLLLLLGGGRSTTTADTGLMGFGGCILLLRDLLGLGYVGWCSTTTLR